MVQLSLPLKWVALAVYFGTMSTSVLAFPQYQSLAGLSERELKEALPKLTPRLPTPPPRPEVYQGAKLVDDAAHPWRAPRAGDQRGPCPGLNTLANHGYLPRDGVASPAQIIAASMAGFNMDLQGASIATYVGHLLDGNLVTDLVSIGGKTPKTGPDPPGNGLVSGIRTHGTFEGDASITRGDDYFGDNFNFNQQLFDQLKDYMNRYGNGYYNLTVAREIRYQRIKQSIATNPTFELVGHRHFTAFGEAVFSTNMWVDGRVKGPLENHVTQEAAEAFFKNMRYPRGFFRASKPGSATNDQLQFVLGTDSSRPGHFPGKNVNGTNSFTIDHSQGSVADFCAFYTYFVGTRIKNLYPNPTGVLRRNLIINIEYFYGSRPPGIECTKVYPYGQL